MAQVDEEGAARLRIVEVPAPNASSRPASLTTSAGMTRVVLNVSAGAEADTEATKLEKAKKVKGFWVKNPMVIGGTGVEMIKGEPGMGVLKAKEGLWQVAKGRKVDGGERRRAEVQSKRRAAERAKAR